MPCLRRTSEGSLKYSGLEILKNGSTGVTWYQSFNSPSTKIPPWPIETTSTMGRKESSVNDVILFHRRYTWVSNPRPVGGGRSRNQYVSLGERIRDYVRAHKQVSQPVMAPGSTLTISLLSRETICRNGLWNTKDPLDKIGPKLQLDAENVSKFSMSLTNWGGNVDRGLSPEIKNE